MTNRDFLEKALSCIGLEPDSEKVASFLVYLELLKTWGKKVNLTSILNDKEIILKHFVDSLTVHDFLGNESSVVDIGTGAGFPGIPLRIYNPSIRLTLIESSSKKVSFLKEVKRKLALGDIDIHCMRGEDIKSSMSEKFDFTLFRAVSETSELLSLSMPYLKGRGKAVVMKSKAEKVQVESEAFELCSRKKLHLPFTGDSRTILVYQKTDK